MREPYLDWLCVMTWAGGQISTFLETSLFMARLFSFCMIELLRLLAFWIA